MFVIEFAMAASTACLPLAVGAMRTSSEFMVLAAAFATRRWLPERARDAGLQFDILKSEVLIGFVGSLVLLAASMPVAYLSFARLLKPVEFDAKTAMIVLCLGICVNVASACLVLRPWAPKAPVGPGAHIITAPEGLTDLAALGQLIDAGVSIALLVGMAVSDLCNWPIVEALAGLAGAFLISSSASRVLVKSGAMLVDLRPCPPSEPRDPES